MKTLISPMIKIDQTLTESEQKDQMIANQKLYLVLMEGTKDDKEIKTFEWVQGRQNVYDVIKDILISSKDNTDMDNPYYGEWDVIESKIIVDSPKVKISDCQSVYDFMRKMKDKGLVKDNDTKFEIDDWYYADNEEETEEN